MKLKIAHKACVYMLLIVFICSLFSTITYAETHKEKEYKVLYISSYHEGYKWSDDIEDAIYAVLSASEYKINISKEYLDTQRISYTNIQDYYDEYSNLLEKKYNENDFDAIITSDDAAYDFIMEKCDFISENVPLFFCGLNNYDESENNYGRKSVGITEYIDVKGTLEIIKLLNPETKKIYYIADKTLTGQKIEENFLSEVAKYGSEFEFVRVKGDNIDEIKNNVSKLSEGDILLGTVFFYDNEGNYYPYDVGFKDIAESVEVPFYGLWEFHLGNGILGGRLIDGIDQGEMAAKMVLDYFGNVDINDMNVISNYSNVIRFDYNVMKKYNIKIEDLPKNSEIINYSDVNKKNILLIHSYNKGLEWTDSIDNGLIDTLEENKMQYEIYREYLDLKRQDDTIYLSQIANIINNKYSSKEIDVILVSDDGALDFVNTYMTDSINDIPLVFCGVNDFDYNILEEHENQTGVFEKNGIEETIELINKLQPEVNAVYIISDTTATGIANINIIKDIMLTMKEDIEFHFLSDMNMSDVQSEVSKLGETDAILMMAFNRDKSGNFYSYDESMETIYKSTKAPIYGVYDFLLGKGIVGGYVTSGFDQGKTMGDLAIRILNGESAKSVEIIDKSPNEYMFDYEELERFNIDENKLPSNSLIMNKNDNIVQLYKKNPEVYNMFAIIFILLLIILFLMTSFLKNNINKKRTIEKLVNYDSATGLYNRKYIKDKITKGMTNYPIAAFMFDIDKLKYVNDNFGHSDGDKLILSAANILKKSFRENDIVARIGGDEFVAIIEKTNANDSRIIKERIDEEIKYHNSMEQNEHLKISISIGYAVSESGTNMEALIQKADELMYEDKLSRR